jgi:uncharacterized protein YxeA
MNDLLIIIITIIVTIFISNYIFYNMMMTKVDNILRNFSHLTKFL